jgi:hypothetical protein
MRSGNVDCVVEHDQEEEYRLPVKVHQTWWAPLLAAALISFVGYYQFRELEDLEAGRREWVMIPISQKLLYDVGGKWGVVGFAIPITLGLVGLGIFRLIRNPKNLM